MDVSRRGRNRPTAPAGTRSHRSQSDDAGSFRCLYYRGLQASTIRSVNSALFYNNFQQALGASSEIFRFMDLDDDAREKAARQGSA